MKWINIFVIGSFLTGCCPCWLPDCCEPPEPNISFDTLSISLQPDSEKITKGDTIWLHGLVSNKLIDLDKMDTMFSYSEYDYITGLEIFKLKHPETNNEYIGQPAIDKFDIINLKGEAKLGETYTVTPVDWNDSYREIFPVISDDSLHFEFIIGLAPKEIGKYFLTSIYQTFNTNDFHRDLFHPEYGDSTKFDLYTKGRVGITWRPLDKRTYFFEVIDNE